jgi:hypothetical protein
MGVVSRLNMASTMNAAVIAAALGFVAAIVAGVF